MAIAPVCRWERIDYKASYITECGREYTREQMVDRPKHPITGKEVTYCPNCLRDIELKEQTNDK